MPGFDPAQYKAALRHEWAVSADGWKRHWDMWARDAQSVNDRLVELAGICPGHRVLDIATGLGEPAFTAARRVGPSGLVVATDLSPALLAPAREEAIRLGLRNVEFREMDAEEPDLPPHAFDAALSRWALMFLPNLIRALTRLRGLLVPGGRFAAAVWGSPEKVPFTSVPMSVIRRVLQLSPPPAGTPGTFSLADEHVLECSFSQAGFAGVAIERRTTHVHPRIPLDRGVRCGTSGHLREHPDHAVRGGADPAEHNLATSVMAVSQLISSNEPSARRRSGWRTRSPRPF
jgi:enediyne biosynthesis protein CalE5